MKGLVSLFCFDGLLFLVVLFFLRRVEHLEGRVRVAMVCSNHARRSLHAKTQHVGIELFHLLEGGQMRGDRLPDLSKLSLFLYDQTLLARSKSVTASISG